MVLKALLVAIFVMLIMLWIQEWLYDSDHFDAYNDHAFAGPLHILHVLSPSHATGREIEGFERSEKPEGRFRQGQQGQAELKIFGFRVLGDHMYQRYDRYEISPRDFNMFIMLKSKAQGSQGFARIAVCCLIHVLMSREWLPPRFCQMCSKSSRLSNNFI